MTLTNVIIVMTPLLTQNWAIAGESTKSSPTQRTFILFSVREVAQVHETSQDLASTRCFKGASKVLQKGIADASKSCSPWAMSVYVQISKYVSLIIIVNVHLHKWPTGGDLCPSLENGINLLITETHGGQGAAEMLEEFGIPFLLPRPWVHMELMTSLEQKHSSLRVTRFWILHPSWSCFEMGSGIFFCCCRTSPVNCQGEGTNFQRLVAFPCILARGVKPTYL